MVDNVHGVITATETTAGDVEENRKLMDLVGQHEANTGCTVKTVVADKQYGTNENFRVCNERGIRSHMGDFRSSLKGKGRQEGIFGEDDFIYDSETDTYRCPAGETLTRRKHKKTRSAYEYATTAKICAACKLREQCTRASLKTARTIKRHYNQIAIDAAREQSESREGKKDRVRRKWLMEGSFGDAASNHGLNRSRWRRLRRQRIQDYMIATVQNVKKLIRYSRAPGFPESVEMKQYKVAENALKSLEKAFRFMRRSTYVFGGA